MNAVTRADRELLAAALRERDKRQIKKGFARRGGLIEFIRYFWDVLEPVEPFVDGWCIEGMCLHLEAVSYGEITRLLINVPPGFMKSMLLNVFWPAWEWGPFGRPDYRYVSFSYSSVLTERDNEKFLYLIRSAKFQALYSKQVQITKDSVERVSNTARGWKFASSVGGTGTGERGNRILADDLHKVKEAESATVMQSTGTWFRESMQNRLNDLGRDAIIVLGQRVNEGDVSGIIIEEYPNYVHFCVPMEFESGRACETEIGWADPRGQDGELAWPKRYPEEVLEPYRSREFLWAGQYQQRPSPRGGGIIKREYWQTWDEGAMRANDVRVGAYPDFEYVLASFDGAYTEKQENDPSACTVWGIWIDYKKNPKVMLVSAWQKRLPIHGGDIPPRCVGETKADYEDRKAEKQGVVELLANTCEKWKVDKLLIESKATGITVSQEIRRLHSDKGWTVQLIDPGRLDKVARTHSVQDLFADGFVWAPETDWVQMVIDQMAVFPKGAHDDLHDTATQALNYLRKTGFAQLRHEAEGAFEEFLYPSKPKGGRLYEV